MSNGWIDGASPKDTHTTLLLMSFDDCTRIVARSNFNSTSSQRSVSSKILCCILISSGKYPYQLYSWGKVLWIDDTEISPLRCPFLEPISMSVFEMFMVGDC